MNTDLDYKLERFSILTDNYIQTINSLLELAISNRLVPLKIMIGLPMIKDYIQTNKIDLLEYGIKYLLVNKHDLLNFDLKRLDELDELDIDSDDNVSRKECISNISNIKTNIFVSNPINNFESNEILDLIVQIKNNSKNLDDFNIQMVKSYVELLIIILEQIKLLY